MSGEFWRWGKSMEGVRVDFVKLEILEVETGMVKLLHMWLIIITHNFIIGLNKNQRNRQQDG